MDQPVVAITEISAAQIEPHDLHAVLAHPDGTALVLGFVSARCDFVTVTTRLRALIPVETVLIVVSTAGELHSDGKGTPYMPDDRDDRIVLQSFARSLIRQVAVHAVTLTGGVRNEASSAHVHHDQQVDALAADLAKLELPFPLDHRDTLALAFIDSRSKREHILAEAIYQTDRFPLLVVGGSVGTEPDNERPALFDGTAIRDGHAVLCFIKLAAGQRFSIFKSQNQVPTQKRFAIAECDATRRVVYSVIDPDTLDIVPFLPAVANALDRSVADIARAPKGSITFGVDIAGDFFARALDTVNVHDNSATFYADVSFGDTLILAGAIDFTASTRDDFRRFLSDKPHPCGATLFDCISRRTGNLAALGTFDAFDGCPVAGFSTLGEMIGININQTVTGVVFFPDNGFADPLIDQFAIRYARYKGFFQSRQISRLGVLNRIRTRLLERVLQGARIPCFHESTEASVITDSAIDVVSLKRAATDVETMLERFRLATQAGRIGIWDGSAVTGETVWDARDAGIWGTAPKTMAEVWALIHPDDREAVRASVTNPNTSSTSDPALRFRIIRPDGTIRLIESNHSQVVDTKGQVIRVVGTHLDVTERVAAERALAQSEERLRLVLSATNDAAWDWDVAKDAVYVSSRWWGMLGYAEGELDLTSKLWIELVPDADRPALRRFLRTQRRARHTQYEFEVRMRHKNGHYVPILIRAIVQRTPTGRPLRATGACIDLTERKRAEAKLAAETNRLRAVLATASDGIVVIDEKGDVVLANDTFAHDLGYTPEEACTLNLRDWEAAIEPDAVDGVLSKVFQERQDTPITVVTSHRHRSGRLIDVEIRAQIVVLEGRTCLHASVRDITARKDMENQLRRALTEAERMNRLMRGREWRIVQLKDQINQLTQTRGEARPFGMSPPPVTASVPPPSITPDLSLLLEVTPMRRLLVGLSELIGLPAIIVNAMDGVLMTSGDLEFCEQAGCSNECMERCREHATANPEDLFPDVGKACLSEPILIGGRTLGAIRIGPFASPRNTSPVAKLAKAFAETLSTIGTIAYERLRLDALRRQQQDCLLSIAEDAEASRAEAEAATQAKSAFLANMSHELRTPLNAILGFSEMIESQMLGPIGDDRYGQYAGYIHATGEHLLKLINNVLDFSRIESDAIEVEWIPFDLVEETKGIVEISCRMTAPGNPEFRFEYAPELVGVFVGDPLKYKQVVFNIVGNAVKFTPNGYIKLSLSVHERAPDGHPGVALVEVEDSGIGIPPEKQARLFKPFSQADAATSRRFGGTGLGLSISKRLVELMGGEIGVESSAGSGTRFWFTLPLSPPRSASTD